MTIRTLPRLRRRPRPDGGPHEAALADHDRVAATAVGRGVAAGSCAATPAPAMSASSRSTGRRWARRRTNARRLFPRTRTLIGAGDDVQPGGHPLGVAGDGQPGVAPQPRRARRGHANQLIARASADEGIRRRGDDRSGSRCDTNPGRRTWEIAHKVVAVASRHGPHGHQPQRDPSPLRQLRAARDDPRSMPTSPTTTSRSTTTRATAATCASPPALSAPSAPTTTSTSSPASTTTTASSCSASRTGSHTIADADDAAGVPVEVHRRGDPQHVAIARVRTELQVGLLPGRVPGRRRRDRPVHGRQGRVAHATSMRPVAAQGGERLRHVRVAAERVARRNRRSGCATSTTGPRCRRRRTSSSGSGTASTEHSPPGSACAWNCGSPIERCS